MSTCGKTEPHDPHIWVDHFDEHEEYRCPGASESHDRSEAIRAAVEEITRTVGNETLAWNLWNNLNTSEAFKTAFLRLHKEKK